MLYDVIKYRDYCEVIDGSNFLPDSSNKYDMAILEALRKQIPMKVTFDVSTSSSTFTSWGTYRCPCCKTILLNGTSRQYCWHCGQLVEGDK